MSTTAKSRMRNSGLCFREKLAKAFGELSIPIARFVIGFVAALLALTLVLVVRYVAGIWSEMGKVETLLAYVFTHVMAGTSGFLIHMLGFKK